MRKMLLLLVTFGISAFLHAQSDECASATVIMPTAFGNTCSSIMSGTTVGATTSAFTPACTNTAAIDDDVWYRFTATSGSVILRFSNIRNAVNNSFEFLSFALYQAPCPTSSASFYCSGFYNSGYQIIDGLTIGTEYYTRIWSASADIAIDINFDFCVQALTSVPANDECSNAIALTTQPFGISCAASVSANTTGATRSSPDPSCGAGDSNDDIWYSFTANSQSIILKFSNASVTTAAGPGMLGYALYNSPCPATTATLSCNRDIGFGSGYQIIDGLTIGNIYYLRLFSAGANNYMSFDFCVQDVPPPPPNNECAAAINITTQPFGINCAASVSANTTGATRSSPDPSCGAGESNDDIWYSFTANSQSIILKFSNASVTTAAGAGILGYALYNSPCPATTATFTCNSGIGFGSGYQIIDGLTIGNLYYLRLFSTGANNYMSFNFCVQDVPPPPANNECAAAINITTQPFGINCAASVSANTTGATRSSPDPSCGAGDSNDDIWYSFTANSQSVILRYSNASVTTAAGAGVLGYALYNSPCPATTATLSCSSGIGFGSGYQIIDGLTIGNIYYLRLFSTEANNYMSFDFCVQDVPPPPANNECAAAINITTQPFGISCAASVSANTTGATRSSPDPSCGAGESNDDIWYSFTANSQSVILRFSNASVTTAAGTGMLGYALYNSPCPATTATLSCNRDIGFGSGYQIIDGLTIGNIYYLRLFSAGANNYMSFDFCVQDVPPPPPNNECAAAINITTQPFGINCAASVSANTTGATRSSPDPSCGAGESNDDIWYSFTANSQSVILRFSNASITTAAGTGILGYALYNSPCPATTATLSCNRDIGFGSGYQIIDGLTIGNLYYLRLFSAGANNYMSFDFCVQDVPPPPPNNECINAITVPLTQPGTICQASVSANTSGATHSSPDPSCGIGDSNDDIWYTFTANASTAILRYSNASVTTAAGTGILGYALYNSPCPATTSTIACNTGFGFGYGFAVLTGLTAGNNYYLRLFSTGANNYLSFNFCIQQPLLNDECTGAINLPVSNGFCNTPVVASLNGATTSAGFSSPTCSPGSVSHDVWFKATIPATGNLIVQTSAIKPAANDLTMSAFSGTCGTLTQIACDENGNPEPHPSAEHSRITLTGRMPGEIIIFRVTPYLPNSEEQFAICAWDETPSVLPAIAAGGNCVRGVTRDIDSTQGNIYMWVPLLDNSGNIIGEVYPNGNSLGTITPDVFVNGGAIRQYNGQYYLDRNIAIQNTNSPSTNVRLRLYLKNAELTVLQAADPTITGIGNLGITKTSTACQSVYTGNGSLVPVTGNASYNGDHYLQGEISSFSSFYFSKAATVLPVYFGHILAYAMAAENLVKWNVNGLDEATAMVLERSSDGTNFSALSSFIINNTIPIASFEYRDMFPFEKNTYYRVKIITSSGHIRYSAIKRVKRSGNSISIAGLWPNPATDLVNITLSGRKVNRIDYSIMNTAGVLMQEKLNIAVANNQFTIGVAQLPPGLYFVLVKEPLTGETLKNKIVVQ